LLPYIYSESARITREGGTLMRPLVFDFAHDPKAMEQPFEFMFGPALLVAPVVEPSATQWHVYLPVNQAGWFNFWTGEYFAGGQSIVVDSPIDRIPLFVRSGSILPMGPVIQSTAEKSQGPIELRIYAGADTRFDLYQDDGTTYGYEKGESAITPLVWNEFSQTLLLKAREGSYGGMSPDCALEITLTARRSERTKTVAGHGSVLFDGTEMQIPLG